MGTSEQGSVVLETKVDFNEVGTRKELHDHARGEDRSDTEFHECTTVGGHDDTSPVKGVGRVGGDDAIEGDLGAHKEDEKSYCCPEHFLIKGDLRKSG